jgi:hypothetical protein
MRPNDQDSAIANTERRVGRPKLGRAQRVRITTTVEPAKLALLREHALRTKKSLGQLADEYVAARFQPMQETSE